MSSDTHPGVISAHPPIERVAIVCREQSEDAARLALTLAEQLRAEGREVRSGVLHGGIFEGDAVLDSTQLMLILGGDGSILSAARLCAPLRIPLLGINFGRVGFLTELEPGEVAEKLPLYLGGEYWVDERTMLQAEVDVAGQHERLIALNDVALVRGATPRVVRIKVWLDGHYYNTTVADGIVISTATGSTAYNLAAGGPIMHPQVRSNVLTPIAPHLAADRSVVLEPHAVVTLELQPGSDAAVLSADGQTNVDVTPGAQVTIKANEHVTRFLRRRPPTYFYRILSAKLQDVT